MRSNFRKFVKIMNKKQSFRKNAKEFKRRFRSRNKEKLNSERNVMKNENVRNKLKLKRRTNSELLRSMRRKSSNRRS